MFLSFNHCCLGHNFSLLVWRVQLYLLHARMSSLKLKVLALYDAQFGQDLIRRTFEAGFDLWTTRYNGVIDVLG